MRQMLSLALAGLKSRRRTSLLLLAAVVFSVVFLTVMGLIGSSAVYTIDRQKKDLYGEQKVSVWNLTPDEAETIRQDARWERSGRFLLSGTVTDPEGELYGLGTADSEALALGHIRLTAGRMPQQPGEIAAETSALRNLGLDIAVGDTLTLEMAAFDGQMFSASFTVVGLVDSYTAVWRSRHITLSEGAPYLPPSFFVAPQQAAALSADLQAILLLDGRMPSLLQFESPFPAGTQYTVNYDVYPQLGYGGGLGEATKGVLGISALLGGMILLCMMVVLLGGFWMAADRRRQQFALLRSIGATRRQARQVLFGEAFWLLVAGIPLGMLLGVGLSFGAVRVFSYIFQNELIYRFNGWVLILAAAVCIICVFLAVWFPAWRASKIPPITGTRPVFFRRRPRRVSRRPLTPFSLMWLSLRRSKGKTVLSVLIFSLAIIVFNFMLLFDAVAYRPRYAVPAVSLEAEDTAFPDYGFFSQAENGFGTPENVSRDIPLTVFDDMHKSGIVERQVAEIVPLFFCSIPLARYDDYLNGYFRFDEQRLGLSRPTEHYDFSRQQEYGYADDAYLIAPSLSVFDEATLRDFAPYVTDGKIDPDAINRGEEIILCLPDYALRIEEHEGGSSMSWTTLDNNPEIDRYTTIYRNENWKAGDMLSFTRAETLADGGCRIHEVTVRVGAIVSKTPPFENSAGGLFGISMGENTLAALGLPYQIAAHHLYFEPDVEVAQGEAQIRQLAAAICPKASIVTATEVNEADQQIRRTTVSIMSMLTVCLLALGFLGLMNTVSNRIYNRTQELGLLRAVGMTRRQALRMLVWEGAVFGVLASIIGVLVCLLLFPHFAPGWVTQTSIPLTLFGSCLACTVLSTVTILLPARRILQIPPSGILRQNW